MKTFIFIVVSSVFLVGCFKGGDVYQPPHPSELRLPEGVQQRRELGSPYVYPEAASGAPEARSDLIKPPQILLQTLQAED